MMNTQSILSLSRSRTSEDMKRVASWLVWGGALHGILGASSMMLSR